MSSGTPKRESGAAGLRRVGWAGTRCPELEVQGFSFHHLWRWGPSSDLVWLVGVKALSRGHRPVLLGQTDHIGQTKQPGWGGKPTIR